MKLHYDRQTAPLIYHKFLKYFSLPLSALLLIPQLADVILGLSRSSDNIQIVLYGVDFAFLACQLVLLCITLYGFYTWSSCGFWGVLSYHGVNLTYEVYLCLIYFVLGLPQTVTAVGVVIGRVIATVIAVIYYCKRRLLFSEAQQIRQMEESLSQQTASSQTGAAVRVDDHSGGDATVCRMCGSKLNLARSTCMRCGTAVPKQAFEKPEGLATTAPISTQPQQARYCRKCGTKLLEDSAFCHKCGAGVVYKD